jgi:trimeric autotransporter adhesin
MATLQTGTAPNQIPTNGDLGDLAFQSKESVQFTGGRGALSSINLNQIYKEIAVTAVDVFVYDTSRDSDGGAWRRRTQHTSWYNETLNTATRGSRREFPSVAVIVATTTSVTIYDGDDPAMPMWMVFQRGLGYPGWTHLVGGNHASDQISCVSASNAIIVTGLGNGPNATAWAGLYYCNFLLDAGYKTNSSGSYTYNGWFNFPISQRYYSYANDSQFSTKTVPFLINSFVNDVAMTVLANAPIDAATGLPIPTIAVATAGGVSIIKHDNTVINLLTTSGNQNSISFTASKGLETHGGGGVGYFGWGWYSVPQASTNTSDYVISDNAWSTTNIRRPGSNGNSVLYPMTTTNYGIVIRESAGITTNDKLILIALTNPAGYSMQSYLTTKYNTGWMPGDVRGAWLSDNTAETMVSSELVTNGDMSSSTGWTVGSGISITGGVAVFSSPAHGTNLNQTGTQFIAGKTYALKFDVTAYTSGRLTLYANYTTGTTQLIASYAAGGTGTYCFTWTAITNGTGFTIQADSVSSGVCNMSVDNVSVRLADPDRSVNAKGLQVFGSITKSAVATGADLVAYSGFTDNDYLLQPYNSSIDLSTNFTISGWYRTTDTAGVYRGLFYKNTQGSLGDGIQILMNPSNQVYGYVYGTPDDANVVDTIATNDGNWHNVVFTRSGNLITLYIDGNSKGTSSANMGTLTNTNSVTSIGAYSASNAGYYWRGSLALWRVSSTAASAEQIAKMYNDEKYLFQDNAKATLYGTSDSVIALAYDEDTQLLHAGTSSGRSVFSGLRRVDNTTTAVGAAISAANGLVAED